MAAPDPLSSTGPADTGVLRLAEPEFSLAGATAWLNSPPLTGADLRGRVVLVEFWTYTCINWLRQLPYVRAWADAYRSSGLVVVGVHSPEFPFERDVAEVRRAAQARSMHFPIAVDDDFAVWRSFANSFWPALYLLDASGRLRHHSVGEGGYEETEAVIRQLLTEAGAGELGPAPVVDARGVEAAADWATLRSAETHLGLDRMSGFASSPRVVPDRPHVYSAPEVLPFGHWAVAGDWTVGPESSVADEPGGRLRCRFHARDLHLVMAPAVRGSSVRFRVLLDGAPPGADHGLDVDPSGNGTLVEPRLHQLVRRRGTVTESTLEIEFLDAGASVFAFTFG
jgi:thiol-disulfide isomerase/thioredoxin